jgi:hypothetical protein
MRGVDDRLIQPIAGKRFLLPNDKTAEFTIKTGFVKLGWVEDEPISIAILHSGWEDQFHVILEFGDSTEFTHELLRSHVIQEKYNIDPYHVSFNYFVNSIPNDMELGKATRNLSK